MPEWVIVGEDVGGTPVVLVEWIYGPIWEPIANVKDKRSDPRLFRDRWRAKRAARSLPRTMTPRAIAYRRL